MNPETLIKKAQHSSFYLWLLNMSLFRIIPFNKPHRIKVVEIGEHSMRTSLPYRKSNFNHIRGLHACGLATLAEFTTGLSLLRKLDVKQYRIIMKTIEVSYFYQGKSTAYGNFVADDQWIEAQVFEKLKTVDKIDVPVEIKVEDSDKNHLATANIIWQVKDWKSVKTKV